MTTIFIETIYEPKCKWCVEHHCDDVFSVTKYTKEKTIRQMREMLFVNNLSQTGLNRGQLNKFFYKEKIKQKDKNKELHEMFYKEKNKILS